MLSKSELLLSKLRYFEGKTEKGTEMDRKKEGRKTEEGNSMQSTYLWAGGRISMMVFVGMNFPS